MRTFVICVLSVLAFGVADCRSLSLTDIQELVDQLGDEILTHQGLGTAGDETRHGVHDLSHAAETDVTSDFEDDIPHPVGIHNWGSKLNVGQVAGITVNPDDEPVIFQRGDVKWGPKSFDKNYQLVSRVPIVNNTILTLDPDTAEVKHAWGSGMFYMPHGITIDSAGNTYVTDVGLHQVMRFPAGSSKPDLVLGEEFTPGSDGSHFCQPTSVVASEVDGTFFVADGYCNSRVLKYNNQGKLLKIINGNWKVVHSLALFEDEDVLCLSDREGQRIDCVKAGVHGGNVVDKDVTGEEVVSYTGVGRTFAIAAKGSTILSVSGSPLVRGITIDTAADVPKILDQWGIEERLTAPHDLAISATGDSVYVVEIDDNKREKVHKFEVVRSNEFI